jgi:hypothetical protein
MPANNLITRVPRQLIKTVTFDGEAGSGASGESITIGTVTGRVLLTHLSAYCSTSVITTLNGELELGVAGNTAGLIAQIADAGDLVATEFWNDATPTDVLTAAAIVDKLVASDILLKVTTSPMTAGVIEFSMLWVPMSVDGNLA